MRRTSILILTAAASLAACEIEQTPRSYIDRQLPSATEQQAAEDELRARLLLFTQAVNRRDAAAALAALAPAPDVNIIGFTDEMRASGVEDSYNLLRDLLGQATGRLELREARIWVGPEADVGWFTLRWTVLQPAVQEAGSVERLRLTGVYLSYEGAWQLVQAHLSVPSDTLTAPADSLPASDSLAPE